MQMSGMLSKYGLVMFDPRWDGIKNLFTDILTAEINDPKASSHIVNEVAERIEKSHSRRKVLRKPENSTNLFYEINGIRFPLFYNKEVFKAGADFVFLGGPGSEMLSPELYEKYLIPDSQAIARVSHDLGGMIYSHICSPIEPFLTMGFYNKMGIDLFETLSPPPVGNVKDLTAARKILDPQMCTRGNVGLDILLNGSAEQVVQATLDVLAATSGSKHMVAASDYLFYDIPLENVKAMVSTVKDYSK